MNNWYVANTHARKESVAVFHIERQGFRTYLPRYLKRRSHARKVDWVPAPMFPRYIFVRFNPSQDRWRSIHSSVGVAQLISHGDSPTPVPSGIVEEIMQREDDQGLVSLGSMHSLRKGDKVQVIHGAMLDSVGIFECADDRARVYILLDLMGREVRVRLPREAVAALD